MLNKKNDDLCKTISFKKPETIVIWGLGPLTMQIISVIVETGISIKAIVKLDTDKDVENISFTIIKEKEFLQRRSQFRKIPVVISNFSIDSNQSFYDAYENLIQKRELDKNRFLHPAFVYRFTSLNFTQSIFMFSYPSSGNTVFQAIFKFLMNKTPEEGSREIFAKKMVRNHTGFLQIYFHHEQLEADLEIYLHKTIFHSQFEQFYQNKQIHFNGIPLLHPLNQDINAGHFWPDKIELQWLHDNKIKIFIPIRHPLEIFTSLSQKVFLGSSKSSYTSHLKNIQRFRESISRKRFSDAQWVKNHAKQMSSLLEGYINNKSNVLSARFEDLILTPHKCIKELAQSMEVDVCEEEIREFWHKISFKPINNKNYSLHYNNQKKRKVPYSHKSRLMEHIKIIWLRGNNFKIAI